MHQMSRILLLLLGLLHLPAAFATDAPENESAAAALDSLLSIDKHLLLSGIAQQDVLPTFGASNESNVEFKFHDSSALGRIRNLRSFSLLTLAETEKSRLFLGINKRGLFGFHFGYTPRSSSTRVLELARMPYLKSTTPEKTPPK